MLIGNRHGDTVERLLRAIPEVEAVDLEHRRLAEHGLVHFRRHFPAGRDGQQSVGGRLGHGPRWGRGMVDDSGPLGPDLGLRLHAAGSSAASGHH
jgi:hypothetical protein